MATPAPAPDNGLLATLRRFSAAGLHYLSLRLRLVGIEGKEAAAHALKLLAMVVAAIFLVVVGWFGLCACLVMLLGSLLGAEGYLWSIFGLTGMHFLLAAHLLFRVKNASKTNFFPLTTEELKKDQAWLEQENQKNSP